MSFVHQIPGAHLGRHLAAGVLAFIVAVTMYGAPAGVMRVLEPGVARLVAEEHLAKVDRTTKWRPLLHLVLYDVEGQPTAYAFLLAKEGTGWRDTPESIAELSRANSEVLLSEIATVITGAREDSPLIHRHRRGLPDFVREIWRWSEAKGTYQAMMLTPLDIRLVPMAGGQGGQASEPPSALRLEPSARLKRSDGDSERVEEWRQRFARARDLQERQLQRFSPEEQERLRRARAERLEQLKQAWEEKRKRWRGQTGGGS